MDASLLIPCSHSFSLLAHGRMGRSYTSLHVCIKFRKFEAPLLPLAVLKRMRRKTAVLSPAALS